MSEAEPRDEILVEKAQGGDRDAFVELYRRYVAEIFGYLVNQLGDVQDAEDVTSETFLRVVAKLDSFRSQASFRTWLYMVARNQLRDHWRRIDRRPSIVELAPESVTEPSSAPAPPNTRASQLGRQILAQLPENYRLVLEMRILEGRSVRDTALELGLSVSNVKVLQHRGLKAASCIAAAIDEAAMGVTADEHSSEGDGDGPLVQEQSNGE